MKDTRGLLIGPNSNELTEMKQREFEDMGEATALLTGDKQLDVFSDWDSGGRLLLRQIYPLPITVTAIMPQIDLGDEGE
jgi:hypothetical protein